MTDNARDVPDVARRAQIEAALADYPHLSEDRIAAIKAWFQKEASALDVAMIASNERITESYRRFRADHIDRLTARDIIRAILFVTAVCAVIALILWRAL